MLAPEAMTDRWWKVPGDYLPDKPADQDDDVVPAVLSPGYVIDQEDAAFHYRCPLCQRPMSAHDADPIGAGLVQYTCPEPT